MEGPLHEHLVQDRAQEVVRELCPTIVGQGVQEGVREWASDNGRPGRRSMTMRRGLDHAAYTRGIVTEVTPLRSRAARRARVLATSTV